MPSVSSEIIVPIAPPSRTPWSVCAMEGALLGAFMVSACGFAAILFHPRSPVAQAVENGLLRRFLMGLAMGATAVLLIYSRFGKRSGAHMNPAVTLANLRLGRITGRDAAAYIAAQFAGAVAGFLTCCFRAGLQRHAAR